MNELPKLSEQESTYSSIALHVLLFQEHEQHADAGRDVPGWPREGGSLPRRRLPGASPAEGLLSEVPYGIYILACRVSDPDPDSIRSGDPDPDPDRRPKMAHKNWKNLDISCFAVLNVRFEGGRLFLLLGRPLWRPWDRLIVVIDPPNFFFSCKSFSFFGQNPGSGSVFSLKCWIRIRIIEYGSETRIAALVTYRLFVRYTNLMAYFRKCRVLVRFRPDSYRSHK